MTSLESYLAELAPKVASWPLRMELQETGLNHLGVDLTVSLRTKQLHLVCGECGQSVLCWNTNLGRPEAGYEVTPEQISASVGAHLRICHDS